MTVGDHTGRRTRSFRSDTTTSLAESLITKSCLYNFDPLKPHFYIVKLGFTGVYIIFLISAQKTYNFGPLKPHIYIVKLGFIGVYIIFLISAQKHWVLVEAVLTKYEKKYQIFYLKKIQFLVVKFSVYLNRRVFRNVQRVARNATH